MTDKFKAWRQTILTSDGGFKRPNNNEIPVPDKKQRIAPKLAPTVNIRPVFIAPVMMPAADDGNSEMIIRGHITGRVQYRKKGNIAMMELENGSKMLVQSDFIVDDPYFTYNMKCIRTMEEGKILMKMKTKLDPYLVPRPINGHELKKTIKRKLKLTEKEAMDLVGVIMKEKLLGVTGTATDRLKQTSVVISDVFSSFINEQWYKKLAECWAPIKYNSIHVLGNFWTQRQLQALSYNEIQTMLEDLQQNPLKWMLKDFNPYDLSPIEPTEQNVEIMKKILNIELTPTDILVVKFYNRICDMIAATGHISFTRNDLAQLPECGHYDHNHLIPACISKKYLLLIRVHADNEQFYRLTDWEALTRINIRLNALMKRPTNTLPIVPTFQLITPTKEQTDAIDAITTRQNVLLLLGNAGTGKTETGKAVFKAFRRGTARAVAAYGEPALRQKETYGDGQTIDMFLNKIHRKTKSGQKLATRTKVLLVDEIGIVTVRKFAKLLDSLPSLEKLFLSGDEKQLDPVAAGPIMHSLIQKWTNTPYVHRLTRVMRVDSASQSLVENFSAYLDGRFTDIKYTNDMLSFNPMKILQRLPIPRHLKYPKSEAQILERFSYYLQQMTDLHRQFTIAGKTFKNTRILVQREKDVEMMNHVMFDIFNNSTGRIYSPYVFYVDERICFKQNMTLIRPDWTPQIECSSEIANNRTATIVEIFDVKPTGDYGEATKKRIVLRSTSEKKIDESLVRVVKFDDGTQINLDDYPIIWLRRAYATTIASTIGSEVDRVVIYIHPWYNFFHRGVLYTAMTRAKKEVVLIMDFNGDHKLVKSDLATIWHTPPPTPEWVLANYIPNIDPVTTDAIAEVENNVQSYFPQPSHINDTSDSEVEEENEDHAFVNTKTVTYSFADEPEYGVEVEVEGIF